LEEIRIDKWLWAVRLYKTRSIATEACKTGRIKIDGIAVKPSRNIRKGTIIEVFQPPMQKKIEVKELLKNRVGAKLVENYMIDHTPEEEYEKLQMIKEMKTEWRNRGTGRPTKKERRDIDRLKSDQ
jgi:ribosome-associated heat shock protein Hsp15